MRRITTPLTQEAIKKLKAGDEALLSGVVYTARDQAHARLARLLKEKKPLPFSLKGQVIYYCGPTATHPGSVIGSCGPTTSIRMDPFVRPLLKEGLAGMIGKGRRGSRVREDICRYKAVYFLAPAGCGALLSRKVVSSKLICFKELGPEAVLRLEVKDFPLMVGIDAGGKDVYRKLKG